MKPILFLDVDGVLNTFTSEEDTNPRFPQALCRVPGVTEFMRWALKNFEVRWLTAWALEEMRPFNFPSLAWLTGLTEEEIASIATCPWDWNKAQGIEKLLAEQPGRPWIWLDDDKCHDEQTWLRSTGNERRFIHVNCFENPGALQEFHLRCRIGRIKNGRRN